MALWESYNDDSEGVSGLMDSPDGGGDENKKPKPKPDPDAYEKHMTTKWLSGKLPGEQKPTYEILKKVAGETGGAISPELLGGSVAQEGGVWALTRPNEKSGAYNTETSFNKKDYPVDAFFNYGLDNISSALPDLIKKGYLPKDFGDKMKPFKGTTEQDEKKYYQQVFTQLQKEGTLNSGAKFEASPKFYDMIDEQAKYLKSQPPVMGASANTAAFKTHEDAIRAKAAYMRDFQDKVKDKVEKSGVKLSKEDQDKVTLIAYNAGMGNANDVLDKMKDYKGKDFWNDYEAGHSYVGKNVNPRLKKGKWIQEYGTKNSKQLPEKEGVWGSGMLPATSTDSYGTSTGGD